MFEQIVSSPCTVARHCQSPLAEEGATSGRCGHARPTGRCFSG